MVAPWRKTRRRLFRLVALNERGHRIGESHPRAKYSDALINRLRDLHEQEGLGCRKLARMFHLDVRYVQRVLSYERRCQVARDWKRIPTDGEDETEGSGE